MDAEVWERGKNREIQTAEKIRKFLGFRDPKPIPAQTWRNKDPSTQPGIHEQTSPPDPSRWGLEAPSGRGRTGRGENREIRRRRGSSRKFRREESQDPQPQHRQLHQLAVHRGHGGREGSTGRGSVDRGDEVGVLRQQIQ